MRKGKGKEKHIIHVQTPEFYRYYANMHFKELKKGRKKGIINHQSKFYMKQSLYNNILKDFHQEVRDLILNKSFDFIMPARMGILGIRKKKPKSYINENGELVNNYPVNWNATNKLWENNPEARAKKKVVKHLNKHSNGFIAKWYYSKHNATYMHKSAYKFIPCRTAKNMLTSIMLDEDKDIDYYLL